MRRWIPKWLQRRPKNLSIVDPATSITVNTTASSSTTATPQRKKFPSGLRLLHNSEHSVVDIILVHGLTGDREKTWTAKNAASPWPQSLLPSKVPNARILTFGYDAYITDWRGMVSRNRIGNHSMNLLTSVATFREDDSTNNRPIIFICHSLGGLVCEDALSAAGRRPERHLRSIIDCTRGIIFLGTPHHGSGLAKWAGMLAVMIGVLKQTNPQILAVLERESEVLARVQDEFHTMVRLRNQKGLQPIEITCFFEELPLLGVGVVVPSDSAILPGYIPIGIRSNHMDMTKFESVEDPGFVAISGELRRWIKEIVAPRNDRILGQLCFRDADHGWALDLGAQLTRFDLLSGTLTDEDVPGISNSRRELVDETNRILRRRNFRYTVPAITPGHNQIHEITEEVLDEMNYRHTQSHLAFFLIGSANYYLGMARSTEASTEVRVLARNRMDALDVKCGALGVNSLKLFDRILGTECNGLSIRRLLSELSRKDF